MKLFFFDLITWLFSILIGSLAALPFFGIWLYLKEASLYWLMIFWVGVFFTYPAVFLLLVAGYKRIRKIGLTEELYSVEKNPEKLKKLYREIFFHNFALSIFFPFFNHYFGLQVLYYRLMGAKIGKDVVFGRDIMIQDLSLVEIGDRVILGQSCRIAGHLQVKHGTVLQQKVIIGEGTTVGGHVAIAPGVRVGSHCIIGVFSVLLPGAVVKDNEVVPPFTVLRRGGRKQEMLGKEV